MDRELDIIVVIDIEATCWERNPPQEQESEIIEIGICLIDVKLMKRLDKSKRSILVRPEKSTISEFCEKLTNLTQSQVEKGISLKQACKILKEEYSTKTRTWASWGDYDRRKFLEECKSKNIEYPFGSSHINVKQNFIEVMQIKELEHELEVAEAMQMINHSFKGTQHRGSDDAYNIALILVKLFTKTVEPV